MSAKPSFVSTLVVAACCACLANGQVATRQTTAGSNVALNTTQALDLLIEQNQQLEKQNQQIEKQNQQLEKQNQELMEQIKALRGAAAQGASVVEQAAEAPSAQANAGEKTGHTRAIFSPGSEQGDDKTKYPQASEGNPAIFGEFNPGRGFTVGKGEYGELNLSGYMVARYLNQFPGDAVGHRPFGTANPSNSSPGLPVPSGYVVFPRMAVQSQVPILYIPVDSAGHESGGCRWCPILHLRQIYDPRRGMERLSRHNVFAGLPPILGIL